LANLLTICIACLVSPHLMYHMFNLYRGLPFPSPALDSETALGFWHATLSRQEGGIHGFTGHLNKAAGPSIWSMSTTKNTRCLVYTGNGIVQIKLVWLDS
jgi:hypothetical protein